MIRPLKYVPYSTRPIRLEQTLPPDTKWMDVQLHERMLFLIPLVQGWLFYKTLNTGAAYLVCFNQNQDKSLENNILNVTKILLHKFKYICKNEKFTYCEMASPVK